MGQKDQLAQAKLTDELFDRYVVHTNGLEGVRRRFQYLRKRYLWFAFVFGAKFFKRSVDVSFALLILVVGAPVFMVIAALISLTDRGPVLFWQNRVGVRGREFAFPKFRSMVINAEALKGSLLQRNDHQDSVTFKMKRDPRVTWIGRILRRTSLDELPQVWCVLKGEMSLVGPRPPVPQEVTRYSIADRRRLEATPGLTCFWQVMGRGDIPFDEQVELDVRYIESQSFWLDMKLLFKTVPAVLLGRGAY